MPRFWVVIYRPAGYDPSTEGEEMAREIDGVNAEMVAAGVRVFVGGLHPPGSARSLRRGAGGEVVVSEGSYLAAGEHVGGFWVLEVADIGEAEAWGRRAAVACRASVEVRPFH